MNEIHILLQFKRSDFEEIYFKDKQANIFLSKRTKEHFFILLTFVISLLLLLIYCIWTNTSWIGLVALFFICLIAFFSFLNKAFPIIKWKKGVKQYLNELSKYQHCKLILTESAIALIMDGMETIERWNTIKEAYITDEFISLTSNNNYHFPKKSMADTEYAQLKIFISERVKHSS